MAFQHINRPVIQDEQSNFDWAKLAVQVGLPLAGSIIAPGVGTAIGSTLAQSITPHMDDGGRLSRYRNIYNPAISTFYKKDIIHPFTPPGNSTIIPQASIGVAPPMPQPTNIIPTSNRVDPLNKTNKRGINTYKSGVKERNFKAPRTNKEVIPHSTNPNVDILYYNNVPTYFEGRSNGTRVPYGSPIPRDLQQEGLNPEFDAQYFNNKPVMQDGGELPVNEFTGPTHEQGGIQLENAEVEGGETSVQDFVFSDNLVVPGTKPARTFADESKRIENRYKRRKDDTYATTAKERELAKLAQQQEALKAQEQMVAEPQMQSGMEQMGIPMQNMGITTESEYPYTEQPQMKYGGNMKKKYGDGGLMALGYGAQALSNLPMLMESFKETKPVNYGRVRAPKLDFSTQRTALKRDRTAGQNALIRKAQRLDNPYGAISTVAGASDPYAALIDQSAMQEDVQNAQLAYDADKVNLQTKMAETEATQRSKNARTSMKHQAFSNLGAVAGTGVSDYLSQEMMNKQLDIQKAYWNKMGMGDPTGNLIIDNYKNQPLNLKTSLNPNLGRGLNQSIPTTQSQNNTVNLVEKSQNLEYDGTEIYNPVVGPRSLNNSNYVDLDFYNPPSHPMSNPFKYKSGYSYSKGGKLPKRSYRRK